MKRAKTYGVMLGKSKTLLFALALSCFGVLQANMDVLKEVMNPQFYGYFTIAIGVIVAVLRVLTNSSLLSKLTAEVTPEIVQEAEATEVAETTEEKK